MKRVVLLPIILALVISCAAPAGAVFALDGVEIESVPSEESVNEVSSPDEVLLAEPIEEMALVAPLEEGRETSTPPVEPPLPSIFEGAEVTAPDVPIPGPGAVIIAQIQVGSSAGASDEYVSIYNNGSDPVDVTGWCLRNKTRIFACLDDPDVDYSIDPGAYIGFSSAPHRPGDHGLVVAFLPGSNHIVASSDTIQVVYGDLVIDAITWSTSPPVSHFAIERTWSEDRAGLLRADEGSWVWKKTLPAYGHILEYAECGGGVVVIEGEICPVINECKGLVISEIAANVTEQFIELHNPTNEPIDVSGCQVRTNRSSHAFVFPEGEKTMKAGEFMVVSIADTALTLTKTTGGTVYLVSSDGFMEVEAVEYANLSKDTSWALVEEKWVQTYTLSPGVANIHAQYAPCEEGYWRNLTTGRCNRTVEELPAADDCGEGRERNPTTGRCRTIPVAKELTPCQEGQYRSEETNRCRSIATAAAAVLKPCADGQFRNPATNRCKKIASADDIALADCGEGRERNPETNRCRNVLAASTSASTLPFPVEEVGQTGEDFAAWWTLGIVMLAGASYGVWEWRYELRGVVNRAAKFISKSK